MGDIEKLFTIDYQGLIVNTFIIIFAIVAIATVFGKFLTIIGKPINWFKGKDEDHEMLSKTIKNVQTLQIAVEDSIELIKENQDEIKQFYQNRVNDREQSLNKQKELLGLIEGLANSNTVRDGQIHNLLIANKEMLADRINQKYKYYISIGGIPEDEYDEFVNMHKAYNGVGGNHHGDAKYEYCINHLPVIPVETSLRFKD